MLHIFAVIIVPVETIRLLLESEYKEMTDSDSNTDLDKANQADGDFNYVESS